MDPRQTGLAPSFSFDSLRILAVALPANYRGLVSSARWQPDPLQLPQVSTMKE